MGAGTLSQRSRAGIVARPGIVAALPGEAWALARLRPQGRARLPGGAWIALSGVGAERAQATARRLVAEGVDGLVSWGSAAALVTALAPGDLMLPREVVAADGSAYATDTDWLARLTNRIGGRVRIRHGTVVEAPHLLADRAAKHALHAHSQALAADMESAAIAAVAADYGLPFIAIRAIADDASMALPRAARAAVADSGALRPLALIGALMRRPNSLPALGRLAIAFRAAQQTLGQVAPALTDDSQ